MVALNFKEEFVARIQSGQKTQTIRQKARCVPGDKLQLFTGQRTKDCRKIADAVCTYVGYCAIRPEYLTLSRAHRHPNQDDFARADGFQDYRDMVAWFQRIYKTHSFVGELIEWRIEP